MVVASAGEPGARIHPAPRRADLTIRPIVASILPPVALLAFTAFVFIGELGGGPMAYGRDTGSFYYPLTEWMARELASGRLPFWLPLIFGGYPLLADGEVGPLYPPNLILLSALPMSTAYVWLRAFHYAVAALGLFWLVRALGVGRFGAWIGALAFAFGSFMVGHLQHDNIVRSAAWLPWLLLAAERALRAAGPGRLLWTAAGAGVFALQNLGVHIQPVLLSVLALAAYLLAGPLRRGAGLQESICRAQDPVSKAQAHGKPFPGSWLPAPGPWLRVRLQIGAGIVALGGGLAAAQLLPLFVLGQGSMRPSLVTYDYATSYAVSPPQFLTLIFPYLFHYDATRSWALWSPHETTLYAGVAPLILAIVALAFVRGRAVAFFGMLTLISLILCLGDYLPIKSYTVIWSMPGFSYLRAPARFSLLLELALACLAALGADWVARRARARAAGSAPAAGAARTLTGLALAPLGLAIFLFGLRWWLRYDPSAALELFRTTYLATGHESWQLGPWHVYYGLLEFSRPDNLRTALALLLLGVVPLTLRGWLTWPRLDLFWRTALASLVAFDLWSFAIGFHLRGQPEDFQPTSPVVGYLAAQPGPFRVFVEPSLNPTMGPNLLVASGLETVNGYSSLEPRGLREYWWSAVLQDNFLLDLFNVRYVVEPRRTIGQRTFQETRYHPNDRLMSGHAANRSGSEAYRVPWTLTESVTVVAAVEGLAVPDGTPVAELTLIGDDGERRSMSLQAGLDVGEYIADEPGYPLAGYAGPSVVWAGSSFRPNPPQVPIRLYGTTLPLSLPLGVTGIEVRTLAPNGTFHLHGLGLRDAQGTVYSVRPSDNAKYHLLYEGPNTLLFENTAAWPRASVVGGAVQTQTDVPIVDQMLSRSWDPTREILADNLRAVDVRWAQGDAPAGRADIVSSGPARISVQADLDAPGFLVLADRYDDGWRAWSGDHELPILRANAIQRAVSLPPGSHRVTFVYDPWSFRLGLALSSISALVLIAMLTVAAASGRRTARP